MDITDSVHRGEADRSGGWHWRDGYLGEHFRRCSYCGSIHPEDLAAEETWHADWADMKYGWPHKFYVNIVNREPDRLYCTGSAPAESRHAHGTMFIPYSELTSEQRQIVKDSGMGGIGRHDHARAYCFGTHATHHAKLYTVHLADPDIPDPARRRIERVSGLAFQFLPDGRVTWRTAPA